ncbi:hypothetical protein [Pseudomonas aeruginosa]|uniref:hypothetical protein n=1 Tax=Pseudomonas aeruginosa TaxID=287 RepID=UPI001E5F8ED8|nr:hypothetical protein [Pseudomonas aeruginosa]
MMVMTAMCAVTAMAEDVHQRTGEDEEEGKQLQKMGVVAVEHPGNGCETSSGRFLCSYFDRAEYSWRCSFVKLTLVDWRDSRIRVPCRALIRPIHKTGMPEEWG